ncbi:hypothetical protein DFH08DRAFT_826016 [Mycena albidolilacea]|uniref:Uncharacterized protein n=1 Tax=Mycena albidolilacea TaxID=1033008 RepID=A0AAD6Z174_9AGAR|nr:hypothetical protein DFH08DRAFT_826016 [Mycena albidolilacea]
MSTRLVLWMVQVVLAPTKKNRGVLRALASSTTASTDVELLSMVNNNEHTKTIDVELVLASLTARALNMVLRGWVSSTTVSRGIGQLKFSHNDEHSTGAMDGASSIGTLQKKVVKLVLALLTMVSSVIAWVASGLDAVDKSHQCHRSQILSIATRLGRVLMVWASLGIIENSEHQCLMDVELLSMVDNSEDHTDSSEKSLGVVDNNKLTDTMSAASGPDVVNDRVVKKVLALLTTGVLTVSTEVEPPAVAFPEQPNGE